MTDQPESADAPQRLHETVRQSVVNIGGLVDGVAERVKGIINDALKAIFDPLGAALQAQIDVFGQLAGGLLENLATPEDIGKQFAEWWSSNSADPSFGPNAVGHFLGNTAPSALGDWLNSTVFKNLHEWFVEGPPLEPNAIDPESIRQAWATMPLATRGFVGFFFAILTATAQMNALSAAVLSADQQASFLQDPVQPLSPAELANATVQNQVGEDWATQQAQRSGLTPELFKIMVNTFGLPPGLGEMLALWNRGYVDQGDVEQSIREGHTKDKYIPALLNLRYAVPTIAEITHWLTRDAFIDEFVQRYNMDAEYDLSKAKADPLFTANAANPDYVKYIWRSHWTLPSPGAGAEMYFRTHPDGAGEVVQLPGGQSTKRIIARDDLQRLYRAAGFEPWWRDPLLKIAFQPLSRIDSRRLYLAGIIDDAEFFRSALNLGYDEETAQQFLTWMQANKAEQQKKQAEKHVAPIITAMRKAYNDGLIGAAEFKQRAVALGEDADAVDVWTAQLDQEREQRRADKLRDGIRRLYVDGFITEEEAGNRLSSEGFTSAEWMRLRDDWRVEIEFRGASDDAKAARALTKGNLLAAYRDYLISEDELRQRLKAMRYQDDEINIWIALEQYNGSREFHKQFLEAAHEDYVDQVADAATTRGELARLSLSSEAIEAYMRRWTSERRRKTPSITAGQVEAAFKNATLAEDKARELLRQLRYTSDEVDTLIGSWGKDLSISEQRLQLAQQEAAARQARFESSQAAQQSRSEAARQAAAQRQSVSEAFSIAQQARNQENALARQQRTFEAETQRQQRTLEAAANRQDKALSAAQDREARQLAERDKALAQAQQLRQQAQAATDARQQRSLQASIDRQERAFQQADKLYQQRVQDRITAEQRAQGYRLAAEQRAQANQQAKEQRQNTLRIQTELRGQRRELEKELRTQQFQIARETRAQQRQVEAEQRLSERKSALAQAQAQAESTVAQLRDQQSTGIGQSAQSVLQAVEDQIMQQIGTLPTGQ